MSDDAKIQEIINEMNRLAGELGEIIGSELDNVADAEDYQFKVETGLAEAIITICQGDLFQVFRWFGYCIIGLGYEMDERIDALFDATVNELVSREVESEG